MARARLAAAPAPQAPLPYTGPATACRPARPAAPAACGQPSKERVMQPLIPLTTQQIGDDTIQTANARELHAF